VGLLSDLRILYHLTMKPVRGKDHAARMESFYAGQAGAYDDFRKRLLKGREELYAELAVSTGLTTTTSTINNHQSSIAEQAGERAVWIEMGGGTGSNLEYLGERIQQLAKVYVVDLSASLLEVASKRAEERGWTNVEAVEADATTFTPPEGAADVVTFSYSLTMIPDWFAAIDNALRILRPGGRIGVVDFYVSRKYPAEGRRRHAWLTRSFWPAWFANDNVFPSADHVPYLHRQFEVESFAEHKAKVPYLFFLRTPYYRFIGRKPAAE
jgi:S-adenosylmethionine-diacylgycerolhomoserine-N-methlytransferase